MDAQNWLDARMAEAKSLPQQIWQVGTATRDDERRDVFDKVCFSVRKGDAVKIAAHTTVKALVALGLYELLDGKGGSITLKRDEAESLVSL